jgi:hypothetical protein
MAVLYTISTIVLVLGKYPDYLTINWIRTLPVENSPGWYPGSFQQGKTGFTLPDSQVWWEANIWPSICYFHPLTSLDSLMDKKILYIGLDEKPQTQADLRGLNHQARRQLATQDYRSSPSGRLDGFAHSYSLGWYRLYHTTGRECPVPGRSSGPPRLGVGAICGVARR